MSMVARVAAALLLLTPALAQGAQWVKLKAPTGGDQYFYDRAKLVVKGDEVAYWKRVVFATPQPVKQAVASSALYRERIDCTEHTLHTLSYVFFSADGTQLEPLASPEAEPQPIIPDTVGDAFERALCPMVTARKRAAEEARRRQEELERRVVELQQAVDQLRDALGKRGEAPAEAAQQQAPGPEPAPEPPTEAPGEGAAERP